jgi:hypothetical protein
MSTQLLVFRFGADAGFEGQLVGALERVEADGAPVLDLLFVNREAGSSEMFAVESRGGRAGGMVVSLISFRLDVAERRRLTKKALRGPHAELIAALGDALAPGDSIAAILVGQSAAGAFADAVARTSGHTLVSTPVSSASLSELTPTIVAATR